MCGIALSFHGICTAPDRSRGLFCDRLLNHTGDHNCDLYPEHSWPQTSVIEAGQDRRNDP